MRLVTPSSTHGTEKKSIATIGFLAALLLFATQSAHADTPQRFMLQGTILTPAGLPQEASNVDFTIEIRSPGTEDCLLYRETHSLNMTNSGGAFSLAIGSGVRSGAGFQQSSTLRQVFNNAAALRTGLECKNGADYDAAAGESRNVVVSFNDGSGPQTLTQVLNVQAVPYSLFAETASQIGDLLPVDILQTNILTRALSQTNLESVFFDQARVDELNKLLDGTSTQYLSSTSAMNFGNTITMEGAGTSLVVENASTFGGVISANSTTPSTSTSTGALVVGGGMGVAGSIYSGSSINSSSSINSGSTISAATSMVTPIVYGSNAPSGTLTLQSTSDPTKGYVLINPNGGNVGIGNSAPAYSLDLNGKFDAIRLPAGTTAQRPTDAAGLIRYNTTSSKVEFNSGSAWTDLSGGGGSAGPILNDITNINNAGGDIALAPVTGTGTVQINSGKASIGPTSGALTVQGGVGVIGDVYASGSLNSSSMSVESTADAIIDVHGAWNSSLVLRPIGSSVLHLGASNNNYPWQIVSREATGFLTFTPTSNVNDSTIPAMTVSRIGNIGIGAAPSTWDRLTISTPAGGMTSVALQQANVSNNESQVFGDTTTFFKVESTHHTNGGAVVRGGSSFAGTPGLTLWGSTGSNTPTAPAVAMIGAKWNGASAAMNVGANEILMQVQNYDSTPYITTLGNGNVGIGVTGPTSKLQVAGDITPDTTASKNLGSAALRWSNIYLTTAPNVSSDARLKKDVKTSDLGLDFINSLRPVSWTWKDANQGTTEHYGVIAQEAESAIAKAKGQNSNNVIVNHDEETDSYSVRYTELVAPLIKAIQELHSELMSMRMSKADKAEIEQLKADGVAKDQKIHHLEQENAEMKQRIDNIEKRLNLQ